MRYVYIEFPACYKRSESTMLLRPFLAAAVILLAAPRAWAADQVTKIFIAQGAISNDVTPMWFAKDRGIFRKYNLEIDNVFIIAGRAAQAMLAGQVPVGAVRVDEGEARGVAGVSTRPLVESP